MMRYFRIGRQKIERFFSGKSARIDRRFFLQFIPRKIPNRRQFSQAGLFLNNREKNIIYGATLLALISLGGIIFSWRALITTPVPAPGGKFDGVLVGQPKYINPIFAATDVDRSLTRILFLPLCDLNGSGAPALASRCEINDARNRAVITLGEHRWHDDEPVTAADVIFTFQTLQNEATKSPWFALAKRAAVSTDAQGHIIISTKQATPEFSLLLTLGMIPAHSWKNIAPETMRANALNLHPVGSGSFLFKFSILDSSNTMQSITLAAFDKFLPHRPWLDQIEFRLAEDADAAQDLFRTRQVDGILLSDPSHSAEFVKRDVRRYEIAPPVIVSLFFNLKNSKLAQNDTFRSAFAQAIDRTALIKNALQKNGIPTRAPFPVGILSNPKNLQPEYNPELAAKLFEQVLPKNTTTTITIGVPAVVGLANVTEELKKEFVKYNIQLEQKTIALDTPESFAGLDLILAGQDYGPTGNALPFWHSTGSGAGVNYARYQIKEVDGWLEQLQSTVTTNSRADLLQKISQRLVNDLPAIFLFQPTNQYYVANQINGVEINDPQNLVERFAKIHEWYTATKRVWK